MKILVGGLVAMVVSVWGIVLVQDNTVEKAPSPATPVATAPTPHDSRLESFNSYAPAADGAATLSPRGRRQGPRVGEAPAALAPSDAPPAMIAANPVVTERMQQRDQERALRQEYRQKWQALPQPQRRALRKECKARGLDRHDPECLKLADSAQNYPAPEKGSNRRGKAGNRGAQRAGQPGGTD